MNACTPNGSARVGRYWLGTVPGSSRLYRFWYEPESGAVIRRSLKTVNRETAERMVRRLAAEDARRGIFGPREEDLPQTLWRMKEATIYAIGFGTYVKIGATTGPLRRRLNYIQTGCPEKLTIYAEITGPLSLERELHARFAPYRLEGEWFRKEGEVAAWIEAGCPLGDGRQGG